LASQRSRWQQRRHLGFSSKVRRPETMNADRLVGILFGIAAFVLVVAFFLIIVWVGW
jgi:hypothetical protein